MSFGKPKDDNTDRVAVVPTHSNAFAATSADAVLGKGSKVVGALTFNGTAEIDGEVEGELSAKDRLVIGESAIIKAKVHGAEIVVRGEVTGDIQASKTLSLRKPARVYGNISAPTLSIEEGVIFEGKCAMATPAAHGSAAAQVSRPAEIKVADKK